MNDLPSCYRVAGLICAEAAGWADLRALGRYLPARCAAEIERAERRAKCRLRARYRPAIGRRMRHIASSMEFRA